MKEIYVLMDNNGSFYCNESVHPLSRTDHIGLAMMFSNAVVARYLADCKGLAVYQLIPTLVNKET